VDRADRQRFERHPDSAAPIFDSQRTSYEELNTRANRLAHHFRAKGVGPDLVCVCLERSADLIVALLGILKTGGAYVPLDPCDPHHRLAMMLTETRPPVLITQERWLAILPKLGIETICMDRDAAVLSRQAQTNPPRLANGRNLAYMIYTSGSTGTPKGVLNVHEAIVNHLLWMQETHPLVPLHAITYRAAPVSAAA